MRVTADKDLTFYYELVPYSVSGGAVVEGTAAVHLLKTGAAVTPVDDDARAFIATRDAEAAAEAEAEEPVAQQDDATSGLDITAKMPDVLAWVGDDPGRALAAHAAEEAKGDKARPRLLAQLEEIATGDTDVEDDEDTEGDNEADSTED